MRHDMVFQDQSANTLQLNIVEGELDTSQFCTVARECMEIGPSIRVEAAIIGASHYVSFHVRGRVLHEVFACVPAKAPNVVGSLRPGQDMSGMLSFRLETQPAFRYTLKSLCVMHWDNDGADELARLERLIQESESQDQCIGLSFAFPKGNLPEEPKTLVFAQYHPYVNSIYVETAHAYPNEGTIAFTTSEVLLKGQR